MNAMPSLSAFLKIPFLLASIPTLSMHWAKSFLPLKISMKNQLVTKAEQVKIPERVIKSAVQDCRTVEEFLYRYRVPGRFTGRGPEYVQVVLTSYREDLAKWGYTAI